MRINLIGILILSIVSAPSAFAGGYDDSYLGARKASEKAREQFYNGQESEIGKKPKLVDDRYVIDVHSSSTGEFKDLSGKPREVIRASKKVEAVEDKSKKSVAESSVANAGDKGSDPSAIITNNEKTVIKSNSNQQYLASAQLKTDKSDPAETISQLPQKEQVKKLTAKDIESILRQRVSYSTAAATIKEIAQSIMPRNWLVETDFHKTKDLDTRLYRFENTKPRQQALLELFSQVSNANVSARYLWDLVDSNGNPTPKLIIFEQ